MPHKPLYLGILQVVFVLLLSITLVLLLSGVSYGQSSGNQFPELCANGGGDSAAAIRNVFFVLQLLGPLFAILFYTGMTVADAATLEPKYEDKRRKVLLYGFSVPIAILFLDAIASEVLITGDISCFFPS